MTDDDDDDDDEKQIYYLILNRLKNNDISQLKCS